MSTNSTISIIQKDGKVKSIYCHWDGYISHNGRILFERYNTQNKVNKLISLGYLSALCDNIKPKTNKPHTFDQPQKNVVIAYHRDRGDDFTQHEFESIKSFNENMNFQNYNYIFKDGKWSYFKYDNFDQQEILTQELIEKYR